MRKFLLNGLQHYLALTLLALLVALALGLGTSLGSLNRPQQMVMGGMFLLALLMGWGIFALRLPERAEPLRARLLGARWLKSTLALLFGIFWALTWTPAEESGSLFYYYSALLPFFAWGAFASACAYLFVLAAEGKLILRAWWERHQVTFVAASVMALVILLVAGLVGVFVIKQTAEPYWYEAGIPVLAWQVFLALAMYAVLENLPLRLPRQTIIYFVLLWGLSGWLWGNAPVRDSFFVGQLLPPNGEHYPFADLETFDLGSQFALIGQGLNNGVYVDRAFYMAFLVYLHTFFGQNYADLMTAQAVLYAIFPALIFLLGKRLHSTNVGLAMGVLFALRGLNGLDAMGWINTSTQKHMLTDFPTALGILVFSLLLLRWLENPEQEWPSLGWAGGVLGLTSMMRPHAMFLLLGLLPLVGWAYRARLRRGLVVGGFLLAAFMASMLPWGLGNGSGQTIVDLYLLRLRNIIEQRYDPESFISPVRAHLARLVDEPPVSVPFVIPHFLNNLTQSALGLPNTPRFLGLSDVVRSEGDNYWRNWKGTFSLESGGMLVLNLALVCLGAGYAWQTRRKQMVVLWGVFLVYLLANSLARTSGGRYLVPVDWVMVVFFWLGCVTVYRLVFAPVETDPIVRETVRPAPRRGNFTWALKGLSVLLSLGLLGGLIPLAGSFHARRYQPQTRYDLLVRLQPHLLVSEMVARQFLRTPQSVILHGRALYPRHLYQGWGLGLDTWAFRKLDFPRTVFTLIGPQGSAYVLLAGPSPDRFPNASDVLVLGCRAVNDARHPTIEAALVVLSEEGVAFRRHPQVPLACPMPEPICNNNGKCR